ncbi:MAG: hypothetical protein JO079_04570, partial [Frankiaceae bacterium]|nr:hypothetical protein [Frankiaceae bacterium]
MLARPLAARGAAVALAAALVTTVTTVVAAVPAWADSPTVTSYSPANVVPGATLHIIGTGL